MNIITYKISSELSITLGEISKDISEIQNLLSPYENNYCASSSTHELMMIRANQRYFIKEYLNDYDIQVGRATSGRPVLGDEASSVDLSLSHKNNLFLFSIVNKPLRVGIDIENIDKNIDWAVFNTNFFSIREKKQINRFCSEHRRSLDFGHTLVFSLKEAVCKCLDVKFMPKMVQVILGDSTALLDVVIDYNLLEKAKFDKGLAIDNLRDRNLKIGFEIFGDYIVSYCLFNPNYSKILV